MDIQKIYNSGLYEKFDLETDELHEFIKLNFKDLHSSTKKQKTKIEKYCVECAKERVFSINFNEYSTPVVYRAQTSTEDDYIRSIIEDKIFTHTYNCEYDENHKIHYTFSIINNSIIKIGQYPSIADMEKNNLKKYSKILSKEKFKELKTAVGLHSHGVGIGAFVYLRRIFEDIIFSCANKEKELPSEFKTSKMEKKIELLKDKLPLILVETKHLYSILSKGIHELEENECVENFDIILMGIKFILDEELAKKEKDNSINIYKKGINKLHSKFKNFI